MGINPPSLYAAFGNKEALFCKALGRYAEKHSAYWDEALAAPTARQVFEKLVRGSATFLGDTSNPRGCLMVQGAMTCGEGAERVRRELAERRASDRAKVKKRFERAKREGDLPAGANPAELANYVSTLLEGMAVQAASGASRKELERVAEMALRAWPA
jgi:AcrR family transcriptional regulator